MSRRLILNKPQVNDYIIENIIENAIEIKKIAFCFLIYNQIHFEELWYNFFKDVDPAKYSIYIHYKNNCNLKYFSQYVLNNCIQTEWSKISLVLASNKLFKEAFITESNYKFILLSGNCIPFKSFDHVYNFLTKDNYGHLNLFTQDTIFPRCNNLLNFFERNHINKSSQWVILNRNILTKIIEYGDNNIRDRFQNIFAPDEHVYITLINYFNLSDQVMLTYYANDTATTFTHRGNMKYKYLNRNLVDMVMVYDKISINEIDHLLESPCLFGRKFNLKCTIIETGEYLTYYISKKLFNIYPINNINFNEIEDVKDIRDVKDVNKVKDVNVVKDISEVKDVNVIKDISEVKDVNEVKVVNVVKYVSEVKDVNDKKNIISAYNSLLDQFNKNNNLMNTQLLNLKSLIDKL